MTLPGPVFSLHMTERQGRVYQVTCLEAQRQRPLVQPVQAGAHRAPAL
jgi:hypothetical protein